MSEYVKNCRASQPFRCERHQSKWEQRKSSQSKRESAEELENDRRKKGKNDGFEVSDPMYFCLVGLRVHSDFQTSLSTWQYKYLHEKESGKAFKGGKSLFESGHIVEVRTNIISPSISFFILCRIVYQNKGSITQCMKFGVIQ